VWGWKQEDVPEGPNPVRGLGCCFQVLGWGCCSKIRSYFANLLEGNGKKFKETVFVYVEYKG
jgi:hypothetical protein